MSGSGHSDHHDTGSGSDKSVIQKLSDELDDFCVSDSLSEAGLLEITERHRVTSDHTPDLSRYEFFYSACENKLVNLEVIKYLLECFPGAANSIDDEGWTPLHSACYNNYVTIDIIQLLIDAAPESIRGVNEIGRMPLHCLCSNRRIDETAAMKILKLLLEEHPEAIRHADSDGDLPLHIAAGRRSPEFCRVLIDAYPGSERISNGVGALPLHFACEKGNNLATVKYLYQLYPDATKAKSTYGEYPIHCTVSRRSCGNKVVNLEVLRYLLECFPGAASSVDNEGWTLLHSACSNKYATLDVIQLLIDAAPESIRGVNKKGCMPLHFLCINEKMDESAAMKILKLLLEKRPEAIRHAVSYGNLPLHLAANRRSPEFCRVLIEAYPGSERISNDDGMTPLHLACSNNTLPTVEYLCNRYPDAVNHSAEEVGAYPIHFAIRALLDNKSPIEAVHNVRFLLDCNPNVKFQKFGGKSLLCFACLLDFNASNIDAGIQNIKAIYDAHPEVVEDDVFEENIDDYHPQVQTFINGESVYARQANDHRLLTARDENGQLPLHKALQNNVRLGSIKLLVEGNPSATRSVDNNFALPLHVACQHHDSPRVIQYLIDLDAITLDALDRDGNTALHYACIGAKYDTIDLLLEKYDAMSVSKKNNHNKLPIELLWETDAVKDRESAEYVYCIFCLLRAYPETLIHMGVNVNQQVEAVSRPAHGAKKRKYSHD